MNAQSTPAAMALFASLPSLGAAFFAGTFQGVTTLKDGTHCAVVLLNATPAEPLGWKAAMAWAAEVGGELPTRPIAALLYANAKAQFEPEWHWTRDELRADIDEPWAESSAWVQLFRSGSQLFDGKSYAFRARAVRLIHLSA